MTENLETKVENDQPRKLRPVFEVVGGATILPLVSYLTGININYPPALFAGLFVGRALIDSVESYFTSKKTDVSTILAESSCLFTGALMGIYIFNS